MRLLAASTSARMTEYATVSTTAGTATIHVIKVIAISLANGPVAAGHSIRTLHNLPQLVAPGAEHRR